MTVLELSFPAGRYHATPWGRHVNEGAIEWPPSPWRIVRALIATWYLKAREIPEPTIRSLADKLGAPPAFRLPRAVTGHTRHFMPTKGGDKTKVFDTFIQLAEKAAILVAWDVSLAPEELTALQTLAARLGYFGRAESLVAARVLEGIATIEPNASPLPEDGVLPEKTELVRLLAPMTPMSYEDWRKNFVAAHQPVVEGKKKTSKKSKADDGAVVPEDFFQALHADTGKLQTAGWNLPPGAQFVNYARPENAFAPATRPRARRGGSPPTVARFAITSVVPPAITQALAVAEQIHKVLCSEKISNGHPIFTGVGSKDHRHAHIFCESIDNANAQITHVTIFASEGFDPKAVEALRRMQWTWGFKGHELRTVLHGIGQPHEFDSPLFATSKVWRSLTPFVATRHAKAFRDGRPKMDENGWQEGSEPHDLLRLLGLNAKWQGAKIRKCLIERDSPFEFGSRKLRSLQFQTIRHGGQGRRGHGSGAAFIIEFPESVSGPIAVGYGAHFGLGLFVPVTNLPESLLRG